MARLYCRRSPRDIEWDGSLPHIPDPSSLDALEDAGIILQEYVKTNTYLAAIPSHLSPSALLDYDVEAISPITSEHKEHNRIWSTPYPAWALEGDDIKLSVRTYAHVNLLSAIDQIEKIGGRIEEVISHSNLLSVRIPQQALNDLSLYRRYDRLICSLNPAGQNLMREDIFTVQMLLTMTITVVVPMTEQELAKPLMMMDLLAPISISKEEMHKPL